MTLKAMLPLITVTSTLQKVNEHTTIKIPHLELKDLFKRIKKGEMAMQYLMTSESENILLCYCFISHHFCE